MARYLAPFRSGAQGVDPFLSLHREMNRLFDDVMQGGNLEPAGAQSGGTSLLTPRLDVSETDREIRVTVEMPGVSEKDIQIDLQENVLVIRGEKKLDRKEDNENFHFIERSYGTFQRALQLPFPVDPGQVQATFKNGVLTITLAKSAAQERSHRIRVQSGDQAAQSTMSGQPEASDKTSGGDEQITH